MTLVDASLYPILQAFREKREELLSCFKTISESKPLTRWQDADYEFHYSMADKTMIGPIAAWSDQIYLALFAVVPSGHCTNLFDGYMDFSESHLRVHVPLENAEHLDVYFGDGTTIKHGDREILIFDETRLHRIENQSTLPAILLMLYVERLEGIPCAGKPSRFLPDAIQKSRSFANQDDFDKRIIASPMPTNLYMFIPAFFSKDRVDDILRLVSECREKKGLRTSQTPASCWQLFRYEYLHHPRLDIILEELEGVATKIFGVEKLYPHRAECRVYMDGAYLPFHYDSHPHDFSVTINLAPRDNEDVIYLFVPDRCNCKNTELLKFNLQPGDALFFHGVSVRHGRPLFTGNKNVQLLLHYSYKNLFNMESTYYFDVLRKAGF